MKTILVSMLLAVAWPIGCDTAAPDYCFDRGRGACGCSGYSKSECERDECCDWYVGEGCDCG